jgi:hypothetical protein
MNEPGYNPKQNQAWSNAVAKTPVRARPLTNEEVTAIRVEYSPRASSGLSVREAAVVWGLLEIIERERGWR